MRIFTSYYSMYRASQHYWVWPRKKFKSLLKSKNHHASLLQLSHQVRGCHSDVKMTKGPPSNWHAWKLDCDQKWNLNQTIENRMSIWCLHVTSKWWFYLKVLDIHFTHISDITKWRTIWYSYLKDGMTTQLIHKTDVY